ncbi:MAG: sulfocyanin-like copper-binding protein [Actinomycetota bacterium]
MRHRPSKVAVLGAAAIALVTFASITFSLIGGPASAGSATGIGAVTGASGSAPGTTSVAPSPSVPSAPHSSALVVSVLLTDSGGPMGEGTGPMHPGAMSLRADRATVPHGIVTFSVTNAGAVKHEMVILPLAAGQTVGGRPFDAGAKIDETGSLGEASRSGGEGSGEGIEPGASGRVTVTLAPGQYELVCNLMGHYVSGMYAKLTVT